MFKSVHHGGKRQEGVVGMFLDHGRLPQRCRVIVKYGIVALDIGDGTKLNL